MSQTITDTKSGHFRWLTAGVILLMIVLMVFSTQTLRNQSRLQHGVLIGSANGGNVMSENSQYATNLFDALQSVCVVIPPTSSEHPQPQVVPLLLACWGDQLMRDLKAHPEALYLALRESRTVSPGASPLALGPLDPERQSPDAPGMFNNGFVDVDDLRPLPSSPLGVFRANVGHSFRLEVRIVPGGRDNGGRQLAPNTLPQLEQGNYYAAMNDFLTIQAAASLTLNALKPSEPMVDRFIASQMQAFTLQIASFDAREQLPKVPEPTDAQLMTQLKTYADHVAGQFDRGNEFGFGYRVPDRVKLQVFSIARADVRKLVEATKTPYEWEVAARVAYAKEPTALIPSTQPASPTTAPAVAPFESVREQAINATIDRATDARLADIQRAARSRMAADYLTFNAARVSNATTQKTTLDVTYDAPDYFDRLAKQIAKDTQVTPTVLHYDDQPRDAAALALIGGFNESTREIPPAVAQRFGRQSTKITGPEYAIVFAKPLMAPAAAEAAGELALDLFKPSEPLTTTRDGKTGEIYFFRLTDAEPNHPATELEPIRERVKSDWRIAEAQRLTMEQASAAAQAVGTSGDFNVAGHPVSTVVVGPFRSQTEVPPGLDLTLPAYAQFAVQVTEKLLGSNGPAPVASINVPLAGKAFVVRRVGLRPEWETPEQLAARQQAIRAQYAIAMARPKSNANPFGLIPTDLSATWLDPKRVFDRTNWKPVARDNQ